MTEFLLISVLPDSHRNLSCLSLFSIAIYNGISTKLLFIPQTKAYDKSAFGDFLITHQFAVVGISVTTGDYYFCSKLTAHVRQSLPNAHIIWGGIHPTALPEECLLHADSICIGEGEHVIVSLIERLRQKSDITSLPGIGTKRTEKITINPPSALISDISALPFNRYDFNRFTVLDDRGLHPFRINDYIRYSKHHGEDYTLMASRSCPYHCTYCINSFLNRLYNTTGKVRRRSVDHVLDEIEYAKSNIPSIRFINFIDDHFLTSEDWVCEFCEKYRQRIQLPFMIRTTLDKITDRVIRMLKGARLAVLQAGIQSGSALIHKAIFKRAFNRDMILRAAQILHNQEIKAIYDFIIENDFETDSDRDQTIQLMLELPKPFEFNLFVLTVFPQTDLEAIYKKRGLKPRIDPYASDYLDYNENDYYYQLASIIPSTSNAICHALFKYRNWIMRKWLQAIYHSRKSRLRNLPRTERSGIT